MRCDCFGCGHLLLAFPLFWSSGLHGLAWLPQPPPVPVHEQSVQVVLQIFRHLLVVLGTRQIPVGPARTAHCRRDSEMVVLGVRLFLGLSSSDRRVCIVFWICGFTSSGICLGAPRHKKQEDDLEQMRLFQEAWM